MGIKFPTPWKTLIIKFPPPRDGKDVKCPGYAREGGMLKLRFDRYISLYTSTGTGLCITSSVIFLPLTLQYRANQLEIVITESFLLECFSTLSSPKRVLLLYQSKMDQSLISKYFILQIVKYLISRKG